MLTLRQLNRTYLARQLLLERHTLSIMDAVERLFGLQAQVNNPPYIGLWTRLHTFERDDLTRLMQARAIGRSALMRSTLHLFTAADYARYWATIQPALLKGLNSFFGRSIKGLDIAPLVAAARAMFETEPRTFAEVKTALAALVPDRDLEALAYIARTFIPLIQVPPGGVWGKGGSPLYALASSYLGMKIDTSDQLRGLFMRYLAAFGPASVQDFQTWVGIAKLKEPISAFRSELVAYRSEDGRELFDLPDAPILPEDTPAPIRFVPEYDNLVIGHDDRTRVLPEAFRTRVFLSAGRVRATILVDGFVRGAWRVERVKRAATLMIERFAPLSPDEQAALADEGLRLLRFIEDDAETLDVRVEE
jgi:hypothetical protein